jgi:hypothetical protein
MATSKPKATRRPRPDPDVLRRTDPGALPAGAVVETAAPRTFMFAYTTGPFLLPPNPAALDWALLNNDATAQQARVTVFRCRQLRFPYVSVWSGNGGELIPGTGISSGTFVRLMP